MNIKKYDYLIDKINNAKFITEPFSHILIDDFLSDEHFNEITSSPAISNIFRTPVGSIASTRSEKSAMVGRNSLLPLSGLSD